MSRENVELVRSLIPPPEVDLVEFFNPEDEQAGDALIEAMRPLFTDDFVCVVLALDRQEWTGLEGLRDRWLDWLEPWATYRTEVERMLDLGDRVLVHVRDIGRRQGAQEEVEQTAGAIWSVRDGKISRAEFFPNRAEADAAAGVGG